MKFSLKLNVLIALFAPFHLAIAQDQNAGICVVEADIDNIKNDRVAMKVFPPAFSKDTAIYNMPKIVPGTYSISDFGRFVHDFSATDTLGNPLEVIRLDTNRWAIANAPSLDHIAYKVSDTFGAPRGGGIFEPGGTNIEAGKNVLMNVFGFAGYFDDYKDAPFELRVKKPANFYGATSMKRKATSDSIDVFTAKNYFELHDCPILYCEPDTTSLQVANARVEVAVYSSDKIITSKEIMDEVTDIFEASALYLGGTLPVNAYTILVYLSNTNGSGGFGALEHNTSTVFVMPEAPMDALAQTFRDVTAHEFFHIVTPLNIHSEQIHDYDFVNPQMSRHLWLYEGCTEYAAHHVQVKHGLISLEKFLEVMQQKMVSASQYNTGIAFTEVSKKALGEHENQYGNVYQQGALIGMALDLKLRSLSNGAYGTQELMRDLAGEYGSEKPFPDDSLFDEIARLSGFPEMKNFLELHVADTVPLPFEALLPLAGITYKASLTEEVISGGSFGLGYNPRREKMVVLGTDRLDAFGKELGLRNGDELVSWNGVEITMDNAREVIQDFKQNTVPGKKAEVVVNRKNDDGTYKPTKLKAKTITVEQTRKHVLEPMESPSASQLELRKAWINL